MKTDTFPSRLQSVIFIQNGFITAKTSFSDLVRIITLLLHVGLWLKPGSLRIGHESYPVLECSVIRAVRIEGAWVMPIP